MDTDFIIQFHNVYSHDFFFSIGIPGQKIFFKNCIVIS